MTDPIAIRRAALEEAASLCNKLRDKAENMVGGGDAIYDIQGRAVIDALDDAARIIRALSDHPPPQTEDGWRSDMEAAKALDEDVILGRTSDVFRIVAGWDEHPDHKGFSWVAPEGCRYPDTAFNRWAPLPAPPAPETTDGK